MACALALCGMVATDAAPRVVSLDLCADQYVLEFADPDRILAVSPEADEDFSYHRDRAVLFPVVRPRLEAILALRPDLVVRSYGGGADIVPALERLGISVLQLGWIDTLSDIGPELERVASGLGKPLAGNAARREFASRLEALETAQTATRTIYTTPGGVTTGKGSLIDEMMTRAGLTNAATRPGWHDLPLETLLISPPHLFITAFDDSQTHKIHHWSAMRHSGLKAVIAQADRRAVDGALTACGAWYVLDAMEAMTGR